jgi:hypothetical protein
MMLNKVGLGTSEPRAMFELMDCQRWTTDEHLGWEIFVARHVSSGAELEDSAAAIRFEPSALGITAHMDPTLETRWEANPHLGPTVKQ